MSGDEDLDDSDLLNPAPCSSGSHDLEEQSLDVDDAITKLLATLQFCNKRFIPPTEKDDEQLRKVHQRIFDLMAMERDPSRRRRLRNAFPNSNIVREQILYLRRFKQSRHSMPPATSYFHKLSQALDGIVKDSFDEEYRKIAISLGVVDAIAEVLVLEIDVFGMPTVNEHRTIRKFIANALTNLTYGHVDSKRKLCVYNGLIHCVVRIFNEAQNLSQVYAGLIRNLSWMADSHMQISLRPTCRALARACVIANDRADESCVRATLSALWNLASHSEENKKAICEEDRSLEMLAKLLTPDAKMTVLVESASGVLKYASQYLGTSTDNSNIRMHLVSRMIPLLNSASFTIINNTLNALSSLIAKDDYLQDVIRQNAYSMNLLNRLRNSTREDTREAVKTVLNRLNQPFAYQQLARFGDMSSSLGCDPLSMSARSGDVARLLPLRSSRASPGSNVFGMSSMVQNSCSLPRNFTRDGSMGVTGYHGDVSRRLFSPNNQDHLRVHTPQQRTPVYQNNANAFQMAPECSPSHVFEQYDDDELSESVRVTRNTSCGSLTSDIPANMSGWQSLDNSVVPSTRMSPVSCSDIPDSPTQTFPRSVENNGTTPLRISTDSKQRSDNSQSGDRSVSDASRVASDLTTMVSEEPTPTFETLQRRANKAGSTSSNDEEESLPGPSCDEDDDYAAFGENDLLQQSIEAALPPLKSTQKKQTDEDDRLLADMIDSVLPTTRIREGEPRNFSSASTAPLEPSKGLSQTDDRLLMDAIFSAMPSSSPAHSPFHPKNGLSGRATQTATRPHNEFIQAMESSSLMPDSSESHERVRDASKLERAASWESSESEESDDDEVVQPDLPGDVLEETEREDLMIDCSQIQQPSTSEHPQLLSGKSSLLSTPRNHSGIPTIGVPQHSSPRSQLPRFNGNLKKNGITVVVSSNHRSPLGNKERSSISCRRVDPLSSEKRPSVPFSQKPKIAPKPIEAIISPFNYQVPKEKDEEKPKENVDISMDKDKLEKKSHEKPEVKPNSKQMLVTSV